MTPTLITKRLHLRPFTMDDVDVLYQFWTDPDVRRYLWDDEVIARDVAADVVASSLRDFAAHGFGHWIVSYKGTTELIGWCGLRAFGDPPAIEVLYGIVPAHWGQGLAVEATQAVLQYGFDALGLEQIFAGTDPPNAASLRVMEKVGMRFDRRTQINGLEAIYYVLARADFQPARQPNAM